MLLLQSLSSCLRLVGKLNAGGDHDGGCEFVQGISVYVFLCFIVFYLEF